MFGKRFVQFVALILVVLFCVVDVGHGAVGVRTTQTSSTISAYLGDGAGVDGHKAVTDMLGIARLWERARQALNTLPQTVTEVSQRITRSRKEISATLNKERYEYRPWFFNVWSYALLIPLQNFFFIVIHEIRRSPVQKKNGPHFSLPTVKTPLAIMLQLAVGIPFHFIANWGVGAVIDTMPVTEEMKGWLRLGSVLYWSFIHVGYLAARQGYRLSRARSTITLNLKERIVLYVAQTVGVAVFFSLLVSLAALVMPSVQFIQPFAEFISGEGLREILAQALGLASTQFLRLCVVISGIGLFVWEMTSVVMKFDVHREKPYGFRELRRPNNIFKMAVWTSVLVFGLFLYTPWFEACVLWTEGLIALAFLGYAVGDIIMFRKRVMVIHFGMRHLAEMLQKNDPVGIFESVMDGNVSPSITGVRRRVELRESRAGIFNAVVHLATGSKKDYDVFAQKGGVVSDVMSREEIVGNATRTLVTYMSDFFTVLPTVTRLEERDIAHEYHVLIKKLRADLLVRGRSVNKVNMRRFACDQLCEIIRQSQALIEADSARSSAKVIFAEAFEALSNVFHSNASPRFVNGYVLPKLIQLEEEDGYFAMLRDVNGPVFGEIEYVLALNKFENDREDFDDVEDSDLFPDRQAQHLYKRLREVQRHKEPPVIIGVAGGSAVGKTQFTRDVLKADLEARGLTVLVVHQGDFLKNMVERDVLRKNGEFTIEKHYRWDRIREFKRSIQKGLTSVVLPKANARGNYKRGTRFDLSKYDVILFEGTYVLSNRENVGALEEIMDITIFMEEDSLEDRKKWYLKKIKKSKREEREQYWDQYVLDDTFRNVTGSRNNADFIIHVAHDKSKTLEVVPRSEHVFRAPSWKEKLRVHEQAVYRAA